MRPNIENFIGCDSSYRAASIVLYGAPYDSTTSYRPGARFGPAAIRHESYGLETYSPYQNADLTDFDVFDSGDLELCFGSSELALADIRGPRGGNFKGRQVPAAAGRRAPGHAGRGAGGRGESTPTCTSSTLTPTPTCGTTTWGQP